MNRQNRVALFNILSTVLLNGISIITGPLFSRLLGDSGYGILKIYNIWVSVIAIVFTLQTQGTLVNAKVEYPEQEQRRYQSSVLGMSLLLYLICAALVLTFREPIAALLKLDPTLIMLMLIQAFGSYCINFLNIRNTYDFRAGQNMVLSLAVTLTSLALSLVMVLRLPQEIRYFGRVAANAITYGTIGLAVCVMILRQGKTLYNREFWKFCIVLAVPSVFHNLSDLVLGQSDQLMLQQMLGDAQVGQYALAWTFANIIFVIFGALNKTWYPFFFEEMKLHQRESMMVKTRNFLELYTVLSCGFILLAPEVYHVYASEVFWSSTMVIPLFVGSYYINFLCTFPVNFEFYHRKTKVVAALTIGASLLNILLNYVLIQAVGMAGAALATVISHGVQLTMHHLYCRKLGAGEYPFPVPVWMPYACGYAAVTALVFLTPGLWLLRWGFGAVLGVLELLRIWKRRVLI